MILSSKGVKDVAGLSYRVADRKEATPGNVSSAMITKKIVEGTIGAETEGQGRRAKGGGLIQRGNGGEESDKADGEGGTGAEGGEGGVGAGRTRVPIRLHKN